jgi:superfamily II DNA or RNA helicase
MIRLYPHQERCLVETSGKNRVAYYLDMGLGKTFVAGEKAKELDKPVLVVYRNPRSTTGRSIFKTIMNNFRYP